MRNKPVTAHYAITLCNQKHDWYVQYWGNEIGISTKIFNIHRPRNVSRNRKPITRFRPQRLKASIIKMAYETPHPVDAPKFMTYMHNMMVSQIPEEIRHWWLTCNGRTKRFNMFATSWGQWVYDLAGTEHQAWMMANPLIAEHIYQFAKRHHKHPFFRRLIEIWRRKDTDIQRFLQLIVGDKKVVQSYEVHQLEALKQNQRRDRFRNMTTADSHVFYEYGHLLPAEMTDYQFQALVRIAYGLSPREKIVNNTGKVHYVCHSFDYKLEPHIQQMAELLCSLDQKQIRALRIPKPTFRVLRGPHYYSPSHHNDDEAMPF